MFDLTGKTALVTGASGGIGAEIAAPSAAPDLLLMMKAVFSIFWNRDDSHDYAAKTPTRDHATPEWRGFTRLQAIAFRDAT